MPVDDHRCDESGSGPLDGDRVGVELRTARDGVLIATIAGDLDYVVTPRLRRRLAGSVDAAVSVLVLDLDGVTLLSAAAMETLLELDHLASSFGCEVRVVASTRAVLRPLTLLRLDRRLRLRASVAEAVRD